MLPWKGLKAAKPVMVQKDLPPNDNLHNLAREAQQLSSEKEKQGNAATVGLIKEESPDLNRVTTQP